MLLSYSIISSVILGFGFLTYRFLMSGESQHALNRVILLSIYAVSIVLPLFLLSKILHYPYEVVGSGTAEIGQFTGGVNEVADKQSPTLSNMSVMTLLLHIYLIGAAITAMYFLVGLIMLLRIRQRGEKTEFGTFTLILVDNSCNTSPFSWYRSIVMTKKDYKDFGDMILIHEHAHRRHQHWIDLMIAYATICLQWYNPAAWAMREELKAIHEYQADESVIESGVNAKDYQMLLLKRAVGYGYQSLANSLNHSKLQKRVTMMYKKKTSLRRRLFALALVPAIGAGIAVTAIPSVAGVLRSIAETSESKPTETIESVPDETTKEREVYVAVETQAEFPGGMPALMQWLSNNVVYPQEAEKAGIQGRVIIKFVIEADGTITNPEILRGVSPELDKEAIRLVHAMPKWNPGKVNGKAVASYFTIPINFRLNDDTKEEAK